MQKSIRGFTIVELLIVIVIIAILAAIVIVAYNGIQNRAHNSAVENNFSNISKKLRIYRISSANDRFPTGATQTALRDALDTLGIKLATPSYSPTRLDGTAASNILYIDSNSGSEYALVARSKSKKLYSLTSNSDSPTEYTGTYAAGFPAVSYSALAADLGISNTSIVTYFVYASGTFRIWN